MAEDELQAVRARLGSYFDTSGSIKDQCVANAMCLALADVRMNTGVTRIEVIAHDDKITIKNDGPALPVDKSHDGIPPMEQLFTNLRACHAHSGHAGFEADLCRGGIAAVNAISNTARVVTGTGPTSMVQKFSVGRPLGGLQEVKAEVNGTRLDFELDKRWASGKFDLAAIELRIRSIGVVLDGVELTFKDS